MKANRFATQEEAQVGIGTMIVFIATILVAAVAAGVLIDTSQKLQDKSTRTGTDAIENVGTNLQIEKVYGDTNAQQDIEEIEILAKLAAGAEAVNLQDLVITFSDGSRLLTYTYGAQVSGATFGDIPDGAFYIDPIRDTDQSLVELDNDGDTDGDATDDTTFNNHVVAGNDDTFKGLLNGDDVVMIRFATDASSAALDIEPNTKVTVQLSTSNGSVTTIGFTTPASYADSEHYELA